MAVKTITIDMEAYTLLAREKRTGESFSKVIKRTFGDREKTAKTLLENLDTVVLEDDTLDRIEELYAVRATSR